MKSTFFNLKQKHFIFIFILGFAFSSAALFAEKHEVTLVGRINLRAVIMFHPQMRFYSPQRQAFKVGFKQPKDAERVSAERRQSLNALKERQKRIDVRIIALKNANERALNDLAKRYITDVEKLDTGAKEFNKQKYLIEARKADAKYLSEIQSAAREVKQLEDEITRRSLVVDSAYTEPAETNKRMAQILAEIKQYTQNIAEQKGIQVVFSYEVKPRRDSFYEESYRANQSYSIAQKTLRAHQDVEYETVLSVPYILNNDLGAEASVKNYYNEITMRAADYLADAAPILAPFSDLISDNNVFIGGADLTNEVLTALFAAYKVDAKIGQAVIKSIGSVY